MASTTALPPATCTARQEAGQLHRLAVLLHGLCRPDRLQLFATTPVPASSSAGCVCLQRPCFAMLCLQPPLPCHAYCPRHFLPRSVLHFPCPLFIAMCARIVVQFARTALLASTTRACSGGPCTVVCLHPSIHPSTVHCVRRLESALFIACAARTALLAATTRACSGGPCTVLYPAVVFIACAT